MQSRNTDLKNRKCDWILAKFLCRFAEKDAAKEKKGEVL